MSAAESFTGWPQEAPPAVPHNLEVEQALLGCILINNDAYARVSSFLEPEHFYDPIHSSIYDICGKRIADGRVADPKTIKTHLQGVVPIRENGGRVGEISIAEYVGKLAYEATTVVNAEDYGRTILDLSVRRHGLDIAHAAADLMLKAPADQSVGKLLDEIEGQFAELRQTHRVSSPSYNPAIAVRGAMDMINAAYTGKRSGWPWMLPEIGRVMNGPMQPGRLYGLLGASGDGKTSMVLQSLRFLAEQGVPFLFLSGEQEIEECVLQMQAQRLGISLSEILKENGINDQEADRLFEDAQAIAKLPWAIEKWTECRVSQLGMKIRAFVKRHGPGVVAIDHAKKIMPDNPRDIFAQQVSQVFNGVKDLMGQNGCAGIILMQRNSDFLKRRNMWPVRSDAYGGEGTLQALDGCLTIYRPARWLKESLVYAEREKDREQIEERIAREASHAWFGNLKNRFGEENRRDKVEFVARFTRFVSYDQRRAEQEPELLPV